MVALELIIIAFASLTLYLTYREYKDGRRAQKSFVTIAVLEAVVILCSAVSLGLSLGR